MPLTIVTQPTVLPVSLRGRVLRELVPPTRIDFDQKVDLPEIQAPYRVSFSDQAMAAAAMTVEDQQRPNGNEANAQALALYREVARL